MPRFLVEVPHGASKAACDMAIKQFLDTGSHFMTNADWGCDDGEHKAWFVCDLEDKKSVLQILPPIFRKDAKITTLRKFTFRDIPDVVSKHYSE